MKRDRRKTGLGRGLSTLLAETSFDNEVPIEYSSPKSNKASDLTVPIEMLFPSATQPRKIFNERKLGELADSIKQNGLIQPIIVRKVEKGYEIVAGERRWRASQLAQKHAVPVVIRQLSDKAAIEYGLVENIQREDLNPIEEAQSYKSLIDQYNYTQEQLATILGKSRSYIANILRLLTLPEKVIYMVFNGKLSSGHARAMIGLDNALELARIVLSKGLSVRQLEKLVRKQKQQFEGPLAMIIPNTRKDIDTLNLEKSIKAQTRFETKINHNHRTKSGNISLKYNSLDEMDEICKLLLHTGS